MARPTKYDPKYHVPWARSLTLHGCTIEELADHMGLAKSTINKWMKEHEEFSDAIKQGREYSDMQVEMSLFNRAMGVSVTEKRTTVRTTEDGQTVPARVEVTEREVPADTAACIFWLKNRQPDLWRDKREIDMSETINDVKNVIATIRDVAESAAENVEDD